MNFSSCSVFACRIGVLKRQTDREIAALNQKNRKARRPYFYNSTSSTNVSSVTRKSDLQLICMLHTHVHPSLRGSKFYQLIRRRTGEAGRRSSHWPFHSCLNIVIVKDVENGHGSQLF